MFSANASQVSNDVKYIEDFCSVYLRTGTGSSQTVTTGVKENTGALVISKSRSAATDWAWYDTFRGATKELASNTTAAEITQSQGLTSFNTDGHTWGTLAKVNTSGATYVDFVLKPTPKFFDVVTYTGNGGTPQNIAHNLGSVPGCIIVKPTSGDGAWVVYHRSQPSSGGVEYNGVLNETAAWNNLFASSGTDIFRIATFGVTSTNFTIGSQASGAYAVNASGVQYVAYLFAHDAGGFGLSGTDNVISCGSYTGTGNGFPNGASITLGYEPQWVMIKKSSGSDPWLIFDSMRGMSFSAAAGLYPNTSEAEAGFSGTTCLPTATGFQVNENNSYVNGSGSTYIYIAIRRGPMKVPTTGTSVFSPNFNVARTTLISTGFPVDLGLTKATNKSSDTDNFYWSDRLRGALELFSNNTNAESDWGTVTFDSNVGWTQNVTNSTDTPINYAFRRAPGFFDEVCYTGTGVANTVLNHNLGVPPELIITKQRSGTSNWNTVYGITASTQSGIVLNSTGAGFGPLPYTPGNWVLNAAPTVTTITIGSEGSWNGSGSTYVAYLFASCPGVSKVGSYTGTGTTQQINCGFTAGARFVLIKRVDSTGDLYVWDSARGIVSGNDPYLLLNSTAAEVTSTDYIDTYSAGFEISSTAPAAINASGGTFIFLAIA